MGQIAIWYICVWRLISKYDVVITVKLSILNSSMMSSHAHQYSVMISQHYSTEQVYLAAHTKD